MLTQCYSSPARRNRMVPRLPSAAWVASELPLIQQPYLRPTSAFDPVVVVLSPIGSASASTMLVGQRR